MMREERLDRLLRLRRHETATAAGALQRAAADARAAAEAATAARLRRDEAERRAQAAAAVPQPTRIFLQGRLEVLERLDEERLRDLQQRRTSRTLALRRVDLRRAMVREEQIRHLGEQERRREQTAALRGEQKTLDDLRREGGDAAW